VRGRNLAVVLAEDAIGRRVAAARKLRGLTQRQLAFRAHVSYSLVTKVETGQVPATPAFLAAVARGLRVQPGELTGQPYRGATARADRADAAVAGIRLVLWEHALPPLPDQPPVHVETLRQALRQAELLRRRAQYVQLAERLPGLLRDLLAAAAVDGAEQEQAFGLLAHTYAAAQTATFSLGYADLAALAGERVVWAAARSGDPRWPAVAAYLTGQNHLLAGAYDVGLRAMDAARASLDDASDPRSLAVLGALHLRSAILASRSARAGQARAHVHAAQEYAARLPGGPANPDTTWYALAFGRANVRIHAVAAEVELGDGTRAVELAAGWAPGPGVQASRAGHHWIDLARGALMHGDRQQALACLLTAREVSPQQTRYHPMVRETLHALARAERRGSGTLRGMAAWVGMPD
jgi:transcriptional regulator with XRE-family HTH domain